MVDLFAAADVPSPLAYVSPSGSLPPEYVVLSPVAEPIAYLSRSLLWISSAICIGCSLYFYRQKQGAWWWLVAAAFAVPLLGEVWRSISHGLPPLPFGVMESQQPSADLTITNTTSFNFLPSIQPLMAIALFCGYLHHKRKHRANLA